jgi:hypothetical protein
LLELLLLKVHLLVEVYDVSKVLAASIMRVMSKLTEAASTSETWVYFHETTWCYNPGNSQPSLYSPPLIPQTPHNNASKTVVCSFVSENFLQLFPILDKDTGYV